jgi:hypothetical protein
MINRLIARHLNQSSLCARPFGEERQVFRQFLRPVRAKGEKVVHRVETLDQMVELDFSVLRMFFYGANEILERGLYDDRLNRDR